MDKDLAAAIAARPAPKVTPERVKTVIASEAYHRLTATLTVCVLTLVNGFTVTGESACASPENYDEAIGNALARKQAESKIWGFEGYLLRERLANGANVHGIGPCDGGGENPLYRGDGMDFGQALDALKEGRRVARAGWNGKGMFAYYVPAASYPVQTGAAKAHFGEGALVPYREYLALKTADGDVATWSPSTSDALATDWSIVE